MDKDNQTQPDFSISVTEETQAVETQRKQDRGDKQFYVAMFPQLYQSAYGFVNSSGVLDTSKAFQPQTLTFIRTGTGTATITHTLGNQNVFMCFAPITSTSIIRYSFTSNDVITLESFNTSGSLIDTPYSFILYATA